MKYHQVMNDTYTNMERFPRCCFLCDREGGWVYTHMFVNTQKKRLQGSTLKFHQWLLVRMGTKLGKEWREFSFLLDKVFPLFECLFRLYYLFTLKTHLRKKWPSIPLHPVFFLLVYHVEQKRKNLFWYKCFFFIKWGLPQEGILKV